MSKRRTTAKKPKKTAPKKTTEPASPAKPWDLQPGETAKSYEAFCVYLKLGPKRSLLEAYRQVWRQKPGNEGAEREPRLPPGTWNGWASRHAWTDRARAHDAAELEADIAARSGARERARQLYVDEVMNLAKAEIDIAKGTIDAPPSRVVALKQALARAGLEPPKQLEHSGPGGGPIRTEGQARAVVAGLSDAELDALESVLDTGDGG